jgi:hypothetical protein
MVYLGAILKNTVFFCLLAMFLGSAEASVSVAEDTKDLNGLIDVFVVDGAEAKKCHDQKGLDRMISSIVFLEKAFRVLHKNFPASTPPLKEKMMSGLESSCQVFHCDQPAKPERCVPSATEGRQMIFDNSVRRVKARLEKAGFDPESLTVQKSSTIARSDCPQSAQYYQDAYVTRYRVEDLFCYKAALDRQLLQLELKMAACGFIEEYAKFATENEKADLSKFEALVFGGIVADLDKVPSTFDGIDALAGIVKEIRGK